MIELKDITKVYTIGSERVWALNHVSLHISPGEFVSIIGPSGSGKSTLLNLLMASHHGYSGSIHYDEAELKTVRSEALYDMISVIQQNVFIFNASIRD